MIQLVIGIAILVIGYFTYGKIVEKHFGPEPELETPAYRLQDGVDYMPMSKGRVFLIQLLNIAGLGPIFGAIQGALFGPMAFIWIALGSVFAGGVHDYFTGMLSLRHDGKSVSEIVGVYLGEPARKLMRVFSVVLLMLVGTVFMTGPANLLAGLGIPGMDNFDTWLIIIFVYYFLATILPIDKIIGKIYPVFGLTLLIMAGGIGISLFTGGYTLPAFSFTSLHPKGLPVWAMLFTTVACGAISGFHATQTPMMSRCLQNENQGRPVFFGAMIAEGIIAIIWAAAAMAFFGGVEGLGEFYYGAGGGQPGAVVNHISLAMLGKFGGILAIIGVIAAPITSGDTAFRSARLTIADAMNFNQVEKKNRLILAIPLFAVSFVLTRMNFDIIWRYFSWSNQTLAMIVLWTSSSYLVHKNKSHWMTTLPAVFMTAVSATYLLQAPEGFGLPTSISNPVGALVALASFIYFVYRVKKFKKEQ
ncbi:carbon starvation protein A [Erysipelothrix urinaevulpis]|uniref:carbon starvation CstA family protein n=1 Tax=Erysipelothrix urinaevulpis TaxID=2683717 RepID=UPI001358E2C4|nr:carbon starvation protein A [Erysipelothrix urinaevulpis]